MSLTKYLRNNYAVLRVSRTNIKFSNVLKELKKIHGWNRAQLAGFALDTNGSWIDVYKDFEGNTPKGVALLVGRTYLKDLQENAEKIGLRVLEYRDFYRKVNFMITDIFDDAEVLKAVNVNGFNYNKYNHQIIEKYSDWHKRFELKLTAVGWNEIEFDIQNFSDSDIPQIAKEALEICPNLLNQGYKTVEQLEEGLDIMGGLMLRWD